MNSSHTSPLHCIWADPHGQQFLLEFVKEVLSRAERAEARWVEAESDYYVIPPTVQFDDLAADLRLVELVLSLQPMHYWLQATTVTTTPTTPNTTPTTNTSSPAAATAAGNTTSALTWIRDWLPRLVRMKNTKKTLGTRFALCCGGGGGGSGGSSDPTPAALVGRGRKEGVHCDLSQSLPLAGVFAIYRHWASVDRALLHLCFKLSKAQWGPTALQEGEESEETPTRSALGLLAYDPLTVVFAFLFGEVGYPRWFFRDLMKGGK
jgi:hypothetical protein